MTTRTILASLEAFRRFDSTLHGPAHWARVHRFGVDLARGMQLDARERECIEVFAWLHDLARVDDGGGRQHAVDGARQVRAVASQVFPALSREQAGIVEVAIRHHSDGVTAADALRQGLLGAHPWPGERVRHIVACCWDADRLDLLRLGREPRAELMSTPHWPDLLPLALRLHGAPPRPGEA